MGSVAVQRIMNRLPNFIGGMVINYVQFFVEKLKTWNFAQTDFSGRFYEVLAYPSQRRRH
jgi:hypothetical protein